MMPETDGRPGAEGCTWPCRVVKIGGSLFGYAGLVEAVRGWLAAEPPGDNILVAGGGGLADTIREWDQRWQLGDATSHWLCVDLLDVTAQLLAALLPELPLVRAAAELPRRRDQPTSVVFAPARFLRDEARSGADGRLPCDWTVTSDSIAARVAEVVGADELVLMKSADPPQQAEHDFRYTDAFFRAASARLPAVRMVNLRSR